jgi:hypothetical protein
MGRFQLELIYLYFPPYIYIHIIDGTTVENKDKLIIICALISINTSWFMS